MPPKRFMMAASASLPTTVWSFSRRVERRNPYRTRDHVGSTCCSVRKFLLVVQKRWLLMLGMMAVIAVLNSILKKNSPQHFSFHPDWHPELRSQRFPTVEERVQLYMSNWYLPACSNATNKPKYEKLHGRLTVNITSDLSKEFDSIVGPEEAFLLEQGIIEDCARPQWQVFLSGSSNNNRIRNRRNMRAYCQDSVELLEIMDKLDNNAAAEAVGTPVLGQFCDESADTALSIPIFAKFRSAATKHDLEEAVTSFQGSSCVSSWQGRSPLETSRHKQKLFSPIIWKLGTSRHWAPLEEARAVDISWESKTHGTLWRGALTGAIQGDSDLERCRSNQRCAFVLHHAHSRVIDAGLTKDVHKIGNTVVDGITLVKRPVSMKQIQQYKIIISLEGNDVASGLKWNLLSNSVVVMPPPTQTSWAMEELLEPWVHYIPMHPDGSNAKDMMQWVLENDEKAQQIAERATLFIYDMIYHPDAANDEIKVKKEIVKRYRALWM